MKYTFYTFLFLLAYTSTQAQDLSIGQWRSHLPYTFAVSVAQSSEAVYFASQESLFSVNKTDNGIELFNKVSGLSDAGVQRIAYNEAVETLFIAYTNSNIDLISKENGIVNISAIKDENIIGDNKIYHIYFQDTFAWLSTGFGIVKFDMEKEEFRFTSFTNLRINSVVAYNDNLYASTDDGVFRIGQNESELYQANFENWQKLGPAEGFPSAYYSNVNETLNDKLYADVNDSLYVYDGANWQFFYYKEEHRFKTLAAGTDQLIAAMINDNFVDRVEVILTGGLSYGITSGELVGEIGEAIEDENGVIWIADQFRGMGSFNPDTGDIRSYDVNGPRSSNVGEIIVHNNEIWVAAISVKPLWQYRTLSDGFFHYKDNQWETLRPFDNPELNGYLDMVTAAVHPADGRIFVGSYNSSLVEYDGADFTLYNRNNSSLQAPVGDTFNVRVSGLRFDRDNNLWISNYGAPAPISVLKNDGTWKSFTPSSVFNNPTQIAIDLNGYKWFACGGPNEGVLVFDDGGTIDDTSDDQYINLRSSNSELRNNNIESIATDLDGNVWVGTTEGVTVFECTGRVFENGCPGRQPIVEEGGISEQLLRFETVNTIAIDGANQKWFGTNNGIFVLDADVENEVLRLNTGNSPLFTDEIIDIAINGENGEVFIGTSGGIISYRATATDGADFFKDVYAFPNPVRPDYIGPIAIKGLVTDANVKITDVSGALVYETTALGGQAIWDGNDYNGRRANSGVYLVYITGKDGTQRMATKVLLMN